MPDELDDATKEQKMRVNDWYWLVTVDRKPEKGFLSWREVCELRRQPGVVEIVGKIQKSVYHELSRCGYWRRRR